MVIGTTSYNVLLIEEDPQQTELYSDLVREVADCKVDVMTHLENSLDWIANSNYHLVVIDSSATNMHGLGLLEQLRRMSPVTSVIMMSDQASVEEAVAAIRLGAEDYLKKPFNVETFQLAVKRGLDRKMVFGADSGASTFLNLLNSCQMISATLDQKKILNIVQSYITRELNSAHSAVFTLNGGEPQKIEDSPSEIKRDPAMEEIIDIALHANNPLPGMAETGEFYRFIDRGQLTPGLFIFRFQTAGRKEHFCVCLSPKRPSSMETFESRLRMIKAQIEVTCKNIEQYMGVQQLVYVDDATGLYNTRYLNQILDKEIAQALASEKSFAVLFIDADKFKGINDTHGHLVGTKILHEMGIQIKKIVRDKDTVFRYGGDEFVAILSPCDLATAKVVAERIRQNIEIESFLSEEGLNLHFTVSIGVALFPDHAKSKKEVIEAADHAMYAAKKSTRNSVTIAAIRPLKGPSAPKAVAKALKPPKTGKTSHSSSHGGGGEAANG